MISMSIRDFLIDEILDGDKTLEIRINDGDAARVRVGDEIELFSSSREVRVHVTKIRRFRNFTDAVSKIPYHRVSKQLRSADGLLSELQGIYLLSRERKGVLVLTIERA